MSVQDVMARITEIQTQLSPVQQATAATGGAAADSASASTQFSSLLALQGAAGDGTTGVPATLGYMPGLTGLAPQAGALGLGAATGTTGAGTIAAPGSAPTGGGAAGIVQAAQSQVGVAEQPPGSNDSPQIAQFRGATAGAGVGPWCAYFASWAARQAGTPLGEQGQGFGSVSAVAGWAQRTGRLEPAGSRPNPGDLVVWGGRHIGIVESVDANGSIHTIEGNSSNAVSRRTYGPDGGGATGYVRMS